MEAEGGDDYVLDLRSILPFPLTSAVTVYSPSVDMPLDTETACFLSGIFPIERRLPESPQCNESSINSL